MEKRANEPKRVYKLNGKPVSKEQYYREIKRREERTKRKNEQMTDEQREAQADFLVDNGFIKVSK